MSLTRMNKAEKTKMNELLQQLGVDGSIDEVSVDDLIKAVTENLSVRIDDVEKRQYFTSLKTKKKTEGKYKSIVNKLETTTLTRKELVDKALGISDLPLDTFTEQALESYAVSIITASVSEGRGALGGADKRLEDAHKFLMDLKETGLYIPRGDVKSHLPLSKLTMEARTCKTTAINWIKRNGLCEIYGVV